MWANLLFILAVVAAVVVIKFALVGALVALAKPIGVLLTLFIIFKWLV